MLAVVKASQRNSALGALNALLGRAKLMPERGNMARILETSNDLLNIWQSTFSDVVQEPEPLAGDTEIQNLDVLVSSLMEQFHLWQGRSLLPTTASTRLNRMNAASTHNAQCRCPCCRL